MLLTFNIRHERDFSAELLKARKVAEFALKTGSRTSRDVKDIGLPSWISNQVLRKYSRNSNLKAIHNVQLTVPGQAIRVSMDRKEIYIPCLKLHLDINHLPLFDKVNQVELDNEYAHVMVTVNEPPIREVKKWIGVDLNSTSHIAVVANPYTGKVQKYGKEVPHIRKKYSKMRKHLYEEGHPKVAKENIGNKEKRKIRNLDHKVSSAIVKEAVRQECGIKLEWLDGIRETASTSKSSRASLHSWSFYQIQKDIIYKAKLFGVPVAYVDPAYTSQRCSRCGLLGNRNGKDFTCPHCGHVDHADVNAAFNIALRPSLEEGVVQLQQGRNCCKGRIDTPQEAPLWTITTSESYVSGSVNCYHPSDQ